MAGRCSRYLFTMRYVEFHHVFTSPMRRCVFMPSVSCFSLSTCDPTWLLWKKATFDLICPVMVLVRSKERCAARWRVCAKHPILRSIPEICNASLMLAALSVVMAVTFSLISQLPRAMSNSTARFFPVCRPWTISVCSTFVCMRQSCRKWAVMVRYGSVARDVHPSQVRPTAEAFFSWRRSFCLSCWCQAGMICWLMVSWLGGVYLGSSTWSMLRKLGLLTVEYGLRSSTMWYTTAFVISTTLCEGSLARRAISQGLVTLGFAGWGADWAAGGSKVVRAGRVDTTLATGWGLTDCFGATGDCPHPLKKERK